MKCSSDVTYFQSVYRHSYCFLQLLYTFPLAKMYSLISIVQLYFVSNKNCDKGWELAIVSQIFVRGTNKDSVDDYIQG